MSEPTLISIVIPVFNEADRLVELHRQILAVLGQRQFELLFVNDGSTDSSWAVLSTLARADRRIRLVNFSRNFGKEVATSAGLFYSQGAAVIVMDADLEHPPGLIPDLLAKWQEGYDVVYTIRTYSKATPALKRWSSKLYYFLINRIASVHLEPAASDFRLLDRKVVQAFNQFTERARIFRGLVDWLGFRQTKVSFTAPYSPKAKASYTWRKLVRLAMTGLTSFSLLPLRLALYLGSFIVMASGLFLVVMVATRWFIDPIIFSPISFVVVLNTLLSGIILTCLGFIAVYIGNIHAEVLNRPLFVVQEKTNFDE